VFTYEHRTRKSVEIVLRRGGRGGERMEGVNLVKIYCKHICKYHNVSLLYNYYMLIKKTKTKKLVTGSRKSHPHEWTDDVTVEGSSL
jgi:hypothetical protein